MGNKKRIRKLIQAKYKPSRKVTFFDHHKFGYEFGKAAGNAAKQLRLISKAFSSMMYAFSDLYRRHSVNSLRKFTGRGHSNSINLGRELSSAVKNLPRSTGLIVGETFVQIKSRKLPSTKEGMEMFGLYEGVDYVVGKCGKDLGFEMPFELPNSWQNVIHFRNGTIAVMVTLDNPNSRRGLRSDFIL